MLNLLAFDPGNAAQAVIGIGGLIFVHELGHFLVGRWCGVRAEAFSIGFGWVLAKWKPGETEYRLSAIPLGGYVKFSGENPDEQDDPDPRTLHAASYPKQAAIMLAGVTMNVIAAFFLFATAFSMGVERIAPVVGAVVPGSPAEKAGIEPGDRIVEVEGHRALEFVDIIQETVNADEVELRIRRGDTLLDPMRVPTRMTNGARQIGIGPAPDPSGRISPEEDSPAARAGLRPGDRVVAVGGEPVGTLEEAWGRHRGAETSGVWTVERDGARFDVSVPNEVFRIGIAFDPLDAGEAPGLLVGLPDTGPAGAAAEAGLPKQFRIVSIDGSTARAPADVQRAVAAAGPAGRDVALRWTPPEGGEAKETSIRPRPYPPAVAAEIGIGKFPLYETLREDDVLSAAALGLERSHRWVMRIFGSLRSLVTGSISPKNLQGPIRLTKATYDEAGTGFTDLLLLLGILSMNLAVLNVLPIPLLDGGQLVRFTLIRIRGKPLPEAFDNGFQWAGLIVLASFLLFVIVNDLRQL